MMSTVFTLAFADRSKDQSGSIAACLRRAVYGAPALTFFQVWSVTVTLKLLLAWLEWLSLAVQVTLVTPTAKTVFEAGRQATATVPSTRSLAA